MEISEPQIYFPRQLDETYHNKKHCNGNGCVIHCIWSKCIVRMMCHHLIDASIKDLWTFHFTSHRHNKGMLKRQWDYPICEQMDPL